MLGLKIETYLNDLLCKLERREIKLTEHDIEFVTKTLQYKWEEDRKRPEREYELYLSSIGRPTCQLQMEKAGKTKREREPGLTAIKFPNGDMLEAYLIMLLYKTGLQIDGTDVPVEVELNGKERRGKIDIIIEDVIFDIKTCTDFSFRKFSTASFDELVADDPFGYVPQGLLYQRALAKRFGGWILLNKNSGAIKVVETPLDLSKYEADMFKDAEETTRVIDSDAAFERKFTDEKEVYRKKETGNRVLPFICSYCGYVDECWPGVEYRPSLVSTAQQPKWVHYTEINYRGEKNVRGSG